MSLYVGNLQWETTEKELENHFSVYGTIKSVKIIKDRETGKSKGFAFVDMENSEEAIKNLNNTELKGRAIRVNKAREKKSRSF